MEAEPESDPVVEPPEVWLVGPAGMVTGRLELEGTSLVIRDGERVSARVRLPELRRVRRLRASPVIELHRRREDFQEVLLLYFARPPGAGGRGREAAEAPKGGLERASGMLSLRAENRMKKRAVREWEKRIREGVG